MVINMETAQQHAAASTAVEAFRLWVPFDGTEKKRETSDFLFIKSKALFLFSLLNT